MVPRVCNESDATRVNGHTYGHLKSSGSASAISKSACPVSCERGHHAQGRHFADALIAHIRNNHVTARVNSHAYRVVECSTRASAIGEILAGRKWRATGPHAPAPRERAHSPTGRNAADAVAIGDKKHPVCVTGDARDAAARELKKHDTRTHTVRKPRRPVPRKRAHKQGEAGGGRACIGLQRASCGG